MFPAAIYKFFKNLIFNYSVLTESVISVNFAASMFFKNLFCFFLIAAACLDVAAQEQLQAGRVTGRIIDAQKKGVPYATVTLLRKDSTVVNGALTDDDGKFTVEPTGIGYFTLRVSGIGIKTRTVNNIHISVDSLEKNLGAVTATSSAQNLKELEVTGEKAMMEMSIDKKVFNVEKNITTAGGSASDVLQNVPSVSVDVDGNVSLRGKSNATILIDGKPATLLGGDVASALQSLPAASVESVEVITNPSAKYDAQGMINIITKRDKKFGINGSITAGAGTRDKYNGSFNLNLKNKRWNLFLNSSFRQNRNYSRTTTERINLDNDTFYHTFENNNRIFGGFFNTIGAEYAFNDKTTLTLTENINRMNWGNKGTSDYKGMEAMFEYNDLLFRQYRISENSGGPFSTSTSLDLKHKFRKQRQELTANVTYAKTWIERLQDYKTYRFDNHDVQTGNPIVQHAPGEGSTGSLNAQADFTTPLTKTAKLDAGWKSQVYDFTSSNNPTIDTGGGPFTDKLLLNSYDYTQQIHSLYSSFGDQKGNWGYQGGLRLEYTRYNGTALILAGKSFGYELANLFPSAYVSYKLPKDQSIYLNFTRRINRPHFMQLMPYVDFSNPQDTSVGNPQLRPEFINNTELNYNKQFKKGHNLIAGVYYQYTQNMIERYRRFYADGTTFSQPQNLKSGITFGAELTGRAQITRAWDAMLNLNFFRNQVIGNNIDPNLDNTGYGWFAKGNTNIKLPAGFSFQLNGNYESPKIVTQGKLQNVWWIDAAVKKNLFNNKATLTLNVSDIFNTRKYETIFNYPAYEQTVYRDRETRIGNISFNYRFGRSETNGRSEGRSMRSGRRDREQRNADPEKTKERENLKSDESNESKGQ
jgi:iron complex outermembrane receptor protein